MADTERPQPIQQYVDCIPGTSYSSARPCVVRIVSNIEPEAEPSPAHTPPRAEVTSPLQAVTPSGSGNFPARRRLNVAGPSPRRTTRSSSRPQQRQRKRSPASQRRQSQLTTFTERFLSLEEQRIEIDRRYCELQEVMVNSQWETNRMTAEGLIDVGEGLKLFAENLKK